MKQLLHSELRYFQTYGDSNFLESEKNREKVALIKEEIRKKIRFQRRRGNLISVGITMLVTLLLLYILLKMAY